MGLKYIKNFENTIGRKDTCSLFEFQDTLVRLITYLDGEIEAYLDEPGKVTVIIPIRK